MAPDAVKIQLSFREALENLINCCNIEAGSDTPDFMLAEYLCDCLAAFDKATRNRDEWYSDEEQLP